MDKIAKKELLHKLQKDFSIAKEELKEKRLLIGSADSAMESQVPTGRDYLEDQILLLENKVYTLQKQIRNIENLPGDFTQVCRGVSVALDFSGEILTVLLVEDTGNLKEGTLSKKSPLGKAIFGSRIGDVVSFLSPSGTETVKILDISF